MVSATTDRQEAGRELRARQYQIEGGVTHKVT